MDSGVDTFFVAICPTCWTAFGRIASVVPEAVECPVCRDAVQMLFTPDPALAPTLARVYEIQERRMRDVHAATQFVLWWRGPAYLRRTLAGITSDGVIAGWRTSFWAFWSAVGQLLHDELRDRVLPNGDEEKE